MNTEANHSLNTSCSTGMRLRNARETLGLTQEEIASRLYLKISIISNIEEDKIPSDLAITFLRGYIRSYAKLVNIPDEEILSMMQSFTQPIKVTNVQNLVLKNRHSKLDNWLISCTWLVILIIISLTVIWWWQNHKTQQEEIVVMSNQQSTTKVN